MDIKTIQVADPKMHECYQLRYAVYCKDKNWLNADDYPDEEEKDEYDEQSVHIALYSEGELKAYCRLILPSPKDLPIRAHVEVAFERNKCAEISRFIVADRTLALQAHVQMFTFISHYLAEHGYVYVLASVERPLLRIIRMYGMKVDTLAEPMYYFGGMLTPIYIHLFDRLEASE